MNIDMEALINDICSNCKSESSVYEGYSGRGMYGRTCWGITTEDAYDCIENAALLGLTGAKVDSMGRDYIVYWPRPHFTETCEVEYGTEETA